MEPVLIALIVGALIAMLILSRLSPALLFTVDHVRFPNSKQFRLPAHGPVLAARGMVFVSTTRATR